MIGSSNKNSHKVYGSPRITEDLQANGTKCGKNRVARLMKVHGIIAKAKKKFKATTNSKHNLPVAENFLNQDFAAEKPNTVWGFRYYIYLDIRRLAILGSDP